MYGILINSLFALSSLKSISSLISQICTFSWCYGAKQVDNMLLPVLFGDNVNPVKTVAELFIKLDIVKYLPAILAIYFFLIIYI